MIFGLDENIIEKIGKVFADFIEIEEALIYGSRAKGNYKPGSDIDIVLKGELLTLAVINKIDLKLDDLNLPYTFDIAILHQIKNDDLLDHISRLGVSFYKKYETHNLIK